MWCSPKLNVASLSMKLTALGRGVHHITTSIPFNRRNSLAGMILGGGGRTHAHLPRGWDRPVPRRGAAVVAMHDLQIYLANSFDLAGKAGVDRWCSRLLSSIREIRGRSAQASEFAHR